MEKNYQFFLVPRNMDPHTNECIARELARIDEVYGSDVIFVDKDGIGRHGWRVRHDILMAFVLAAEKDTRIKVIPFVRQGGGQYRQYELPAIKKTSRKKAAAKKQLEEIKKRK